MVLCDTVLSLNVTFEVNPCCGRIVVYMHKTKNIYYQNKNSTDIELGCMI